MMLRKCLAVLVLVCLALPLAAQDLPPLSELPQGEWTKIAVPGQKCLYGSDYSFFVRPASEPTDNLMIYFQGGGACWDGLTCAARGQFASAYEVRDSAEQNGLLDFSNEANPVRDYNTVYVPYCSGDIHTGNVGEVTLEIAEAMQPMAQAMGITENSVTVNFDGFDNASAVLAWVYENYAEPKQVFVTGCSAGGYGAINHAAYIMNNYAGTRVVMLADASNGVTPPGWNGLASWNTLGNLPDFIPALADVTPEQYSATYHIRAMARFFPDNVFAEYNTFLDQVQVGFYAFMTGRQVNAENFAQIAPEWSKELLENVKSLEVTVPNYHNYLAGGLVHCITGAPIAYEYEVQGVKFTDWVQSLLDGTVRRSPTCDVSAGECTQSPATGG
jgi:hypothetical protein